MYFKNLRNMVTKEMTTAKLRYFERVSNEAKRNPKKVWKELDRLLGNVKRCVSELSTAKGTLTDQKSIVEEFNTYFSSLVGVLDECDSAVINEIPVSHHEFSFSKVDEEDVLGLLGSLDVNKATGSDGKERSEIEYEENAAAFVR